MRWHQVTLGGCHSLEDMGCQSGGHACISVRAPQQGRHVGCGHGAPVLLWPSHPRFAKGRSGPRSTGQNR